MNGLFRTITLALPLLALCQVSLAMETDQYMAWKHPIADSADAINGYVNDRIEAVLTRLNRKSHKRPLIATQPLSCGELVPLVMGTFDDNIDIISTIEKWIYDGGEVDAYPPADWSHTRIIKASIYRDSWLFRLKIFGKTLNIGGVRVGIDKIGHFFAQGLGYYDVYTGALASGANLRQAVNAAIDHGIRQEETYFGYTVSGVFSHGDLDANYQGFRLARSLCEGRAPQLARDQAGRWSLVRPIDLRDYVNPAWDESFNLSHYDESRWKGVKPNLLGYCALRHDPEVTALMESYDRRPHEDYSTRYLARQVATGRIHDPQPQSLDAICPR